ncbi:MAG TPA: S9 family peptidase [Anaerolineae bacterium]|nr:S9 family peptidase [Anaerolineae bacterium]HQI84263.1 S9 family peptidase [Anaerolineae bacterium]
MAENIAVPLIPREVLFGNPDKAQARISPDGSKLAYLAPLDGVLNVWVGPADAPEKAQPVTRDTGRGIRFYLWAYTSAHVLYIQDKGGDENWRVYSVAVETGESIDLTPLEGVNAQFQEVSAKFPEEILVGLNDRDPRFHDIYRIHIATGERRCIQHNEAFAGFVTDDEYAIRFALRTTPDGGMEILSPADDAWTPYINIPMEDSMMTGVAGFDKTGQVLYMTDSRERNTSALFAVDLATGARTLLAEDPKSDVSGAMVHPTEKHFQAVAFNYERKDWRILDPAIADDMAYLQTVADGDIEVVSRTLDDQTWIVAYLMDNGPVRYYRYDRATRQAHFLFTNRQDLEGLPLVKMTPVVIPTRDGWDMVCYYSLPLGADTDGDNIPDAPLPTVLWVHGGPWGRDEWGYNPYHQWFANRGYAVLSVNFRASTGFGKDFINAGNREWGAKMHDDLLDAVQWAVAAGIADPARVAIAGGSYGGYATLAGLTFTPETFACGVDIVGPSNLVTLLESMPPYWKPMLEMFTTRVGDHRTEEGRAFLTSCSPLTYADRICRPLLIGQGANDPRVKQAESDQIVQAMQAKNIPVTYVLYPDEGHGFARPENRLSFNAITEAFLAECLGGRYEPVGDAFKGSSITIPVGAEHIPGLSASHEG